MSVFPDTSTDTSTTILIIQGLNTQILSYVCSFFKECKWAPKPGTQAKLSPFWTNLGDNRRSTVKCQDRQHNQDPAIIVKEERTEYK